MSKKLLQIFFYSFFFISCETTELPLTFNSIDSTQSGIFFSNDVKAKSELSVIDFEYLYNGAGVGIGDFNNDGLPDIVFSGNEVASRLYLNTSKLTFKDVTLESGFNDQGLWGSGVSVVDINGDGLLDIYLCVSGSHEFPSRKNLFFINKGPDNFGIPKFEEQAAEMGLDDNHYTTQAAFFDYDKDGDLDVYLLINSSEILNPNIIKVRSADGSAIHTDRLYRNMGIVNGALPTFEDVSMEAGIVWDGFGLGVVVSDLNLDGWQDIYISNDYITNDVMYINNQDGTFTNKIAEFVKHQSRSSMGMDIADFNNDMLPDIAVLDMLPTDNFGRKVALGIDNYRGERIANLLGYEDQYIRNVLQIHNGRVPLTQDDVSFSEIGRLSGIESTDWSWSLLFADFDNDGWKDIHIANGYPEELTNMDFIDFRGMMSRSAFDESAARDYLFRLLSELRPIKRPNIIYRNNSDLTFKDISYKAGIVDSTFSYGAVFADFDLDGDLDIVVNNLNQVAHLYENTSKGGNFFRVKLIGDKYNTDGIGTKIWIETASGKQFLEQSPYRGYQSTVENILHFGLGNDSIIHKLSVQWPDDKIQVLNQIPVNQVFNLHYENAEIKVTDSTDSVAQLVKQVITIGYKHQEQEYLDFDREKLLPHRFSQNGPGIAIGDINGDGEDDLVVGGAGGQPTNVFISSNGRFVKHQELDGAEHEDMGLLLFDADGDDDLDLYVVSGGNEEKIEAYYQDRIYLNDGAGIYTLSKKSLPEIKSSGSCVIAQDYDGDGDLDLFVGGRVVPGQYAMAAESFILRNDSKNGNVIFTDISDLLNPSIKHIGMVTSALWTDSDLDGWYDLIIVGEWMPVTIFRNNQGQSFERVGVESFQNSEGWWNSVTGGDLDNDGDMDYVIGNIGENTPFKVSPVQPLTVYAEDFDNNGTWDPVLTHYLNGQEVLVHSYDVLGSQLPSVKIQFKRYAQFAQSNFHDFLSKEAQSKAMVKQLKYQSSVWIENSGDFNFIIHKLPKIAQSAPIYGVQCLDLSDDTFLDLVLVGNSYAPYLRTGKYDAFTGLILNGTASKEFVPVVSRTSGFFIDGDAKAMATIYHEDELKLVISQNNDSLKIVDFNHVPLQEIRHDVLQNSSLVELNDGSFRYHEHYLGNGYLSQNSHVYFFPKGSKSNDTISKSDHKAQ